MLQEDRLISFDWAVKTLLREKDNFGILEGFISELLCKDVKIEKILEGEGDKVNLLIKKNGFPAIVMLQNESNVDYIGRILHEVSEMVVKSAEIEWELTIKKVILINIMYSSFNGGGDYIFSGGMNFVGENHQDTMKMPPTMEEVCPEYYVLFVDKFFDDVKDGVDEWMYFLKNGEILPTFSAKGIAQARDRFRVSNLSAEERERYLRYIEECGDGNKEEDNDDDA